MSIHINQIKKRRSLKPLPKRGRRDDDSVSTNTDLPRGKQRRIFWTAEEDAVLVVIFYMILCRFYN